VLASVVNIKPSTLKFLCGLPMRFPTKLGG